MEYDEYDVLGNFKDLENIFKNVPTAAPVEPPCANLEDTFDDESLLELGAGPSVNKKKEEKKKATSAKTSKADKKKTLTKKPDVAPKTDELVVVNSDSSVQKEGIALRTRRSLRGNQNNTFAESSASNSPDKSAKSGKKTARVRRNKSSTNAALLTTSPIIEASGVVSGSRRNLSNRGGRGRGGRSRKNNTSATSVSNAHVLETIEIDDAESSTFVRRANGETRDVARARRNMIAEHAARCPTVDVVDLVASPMIRIEGIIDVDAEDDGKQTVKTSAAKQQTLNSSFEEDNPEISIKINWELKPQVFKLRKYQKFTTIFEQLAEREKVAIDQIFLNLNNQILKPDDTPDSINYEIYHIIDGRAMKDFGFVGTGAIPKKKRDPNIISLKVQSDKFKKPLNIELNKTENFRKLVIKCAEELKIPYDNIIKLCFDGENLDYLQTPVDLELEGGEIMEIHLK